MMRLTSSVIWCLAFILGLFATAIPWGGVLVFVASAIAELVIFRLKPGEFPRRTWLIAGAIALVASFYLPLRSPHPGIHDVSRFISDTSQTIRVSGTVEELPKLTRSGKAQVWLNVNAIAGLDDRVNGKLYATMAANDAKDLYPGEAIALTGTLYQPPRAMNPGGFDFQQYLAKDGSFAGFRAEKLHLLNPTEEPPKWGLWRIQKHIVQSQAQRLGDREGALLSAMVLGNQVTNIPFDIKDSFTRIGLSHALAASGFQVSLILGVVLAVTKRSPKAIQVAIGSLGLLLFLGLAGCQPAVVRAVLMGFAVLIAVWTDRKIKPIGSLLIVVTVLLVMTPLWIWDLGFQLSVLATLGLLVTASGLTKWLDWIPNTIAPLIAVPIAAYLWTLPLQLYSFGSVSPYSIPVNILVSPLISILSLGGVVSAVLSVVPSVGSFAAWLLHYPIVLLIAIVNFFCRLPGNSFSVGTIPLALMLLLYGLILFVWLRPQILRWWWILGVVAASLVFVPVAYAQTSTLQINAIAAAQTPVLVVQDQGRIGLVNVGDATIAQTTILPFLQQQGVNQIDWAIAANPATPNGWTTVLNQLPIQKLYDISDPKRPAIESTTLEQYRGSYQRLDGTRDLVNGAIAIRPLSVRPSVIQFQIGRDRWLWLKDVPTVEERKFLLDTARGNEVLWWSGRFLAPKLLDGLAPKAAIATAKVHPETLKYFQRHHIPVYSTAEYGAIQWLPKQGLRLAMRSSDVTSP